MKQIIKHDITHRCLSMFLVIVMVMSIIPLNLLAATPGVVSTNIGQKEFVVGTPTEFTVSTKANDDLDTLVKGSFTFSDPSAVELLEYKDSSTGLWYAFSGDFGPETGFPMKDATSEFRVTFAKTGVYSTEIFIKAVEDGSVVCSATATVSVSGTGSRLTTDIDKKVFVVGEEYTEFGFTTWATTDAGKTVRAYFEFSDRDALKSLQYYNVNTDTFDEFYGAFGPETGFPLVDNLTSTFRASFKKAGVYTVNAYIKELDGNILCVRTANVVVKNSSPISFTQESVEIKYSDVNATNSTLVDSVSGAEYTYKSNDETVVKVNEYGILVPAGIGETTVTVTRKENINYVSATASYKVTVVPGVQDALTWDKSVPESIKWNDEEGYSNTVKGGSGDGNVTYTSNNTDVAEVDPATGVLTLKKPGTVTVTATKTGGTLYADQTASYTLAVIKSEQAALVFGESNPDSIYVGDTYTNAVTGGSASGAVVYKSSDDTVATVDENGKITALRVPAGSEFAVVTVTASLAGDEYYEDATAVSYTLTINRAPQKTTLVFEKGAIGQKIKYGEEYTNAVSGGDTVPVSYRSSDETVAKVDSEGKVTAFKAGTVTITASVPESEIYQAQSASYELVIELADQTVTFANGNTNIPAITYGDSYENKASATTAVTYSSSAPDTVDVDANGKLIIKKSGTVVITATAAETEQYAKATSSYTITVNKAEQTITFEKGNDIKVTFNDNENKFSNVASSNATKGTDEDKKDIEVLYSIASGKDLVVANSFDSATGAFEIKGAGTIVITVSFTSNARYKANMASYTLEVEKADQTISFAQTTYEMVNGYNSFVAPVASEQGELYGTGKIVYSIEKNDDDVVSAIDFETGALTFKNKTGEVTVLATKVADDNYNETTATYTLNIADADLEGNTYHSIVGDQIDDASQWYTGNVSIKAAEGYLLSYAKDVDNADWQDVLADAVTADGTHSVTFHVRHVESGKIYAAQTVTIKRDTTDPAAKINHEGLTGWDKFLSIITLGLWEPAEMSFSIEQSDATSGVKKIEYYVDEGTTVVKSEAELDALADTEWTEYNGNIEVASDKIFVVYAKVTDNAGQHIYATTNGIVFDRTAPTGSIKIDSPVFNGFYKSDVELTITAEDAEPSSGIAEITYKIESANASETGTLYTFDVENPKYTDLESTVERKLTVDSIKFNGDKVKVTVYVKDNAGNTNVQEISVELNISITPLKLEVTYIDEPDVEIQEYKGVKYYNAPRKARIVVTGRTSVFAASVAPAVYVTETRGDTASTTTWFGEYWETTEVEGDPDAAVHEYIAHFNGSANYEFSVDYTDVFGNELTYTSEKFAVDLDAPTAKITIDRDNTWTTLLETLTFGLWKNEKVTVKAEAEDATSDIKPLEMYVVYVSDSTDIMNSEELDALYEKGEFTGYSEYTVTEDAKFVVYIRAEDHAGHRTYVSSDGFVVDMTDSEIVLTPEETELEHNGIPLYNGDVDVRIDVAELKDGSYSGIKEVKYWVECDGVVSQPEEILYSFDYSKNDYPTGAPTYEQLLHKFTKTVTIEAEKNNSCKVELFVGVTDNAGNYNEEKVAVDIDITPPEIALSYDNNKPYKVDGDRGYYPENRKATIVITEREGHFEAFKATAGISVKALDVNDKPIIVNGAELEVDENKYLVDISKLFEEIKWETTLGSTPDEATHKTELPYNYDANYSFDIVYTDLAGNINNDIFTDEFQKTPYKFTVDKVKPAPTVYALDQEWDKLLNVLTFGLYSNNEETVKVDYIEDTSPIEFIGYCKIKCRNAAEAELKAEEALEAIQEWEDITETKEFTITEDDRVVVYIKIVDYAGNKQYISTDGIIVDMTEAGIVLTPEETELKHGDVPLYNGDVDVQIDVTENKAESYSGIKEVKYWVECDGERTQEGILYSYEYVRDKESNNGGHLVIKEANEKGELVTVLDKAGYTPTFEELLHKYTRTVTIDSNKNNSCKVELFVGVTDNAGNYKEEKVAVDIDITPPTIEVEFNDNVPNKVVGDKGYFKGENARIATVKIKERTEHFNAKKATESIKITAVNASGESVNENCSALVGEWETKGVGDEATHTAFIDFTADANYEFTLSYEDLATNECKYEEVKFAEGTVTPRYFAVDKTKPTAKVFAGTLGTWEKLVETLTFGIWSKNSVDVTGTAADVTTPIESISYIKTDKTEKFDIKELETMAGWNSIDVAPDYHVTKVVPDERFVVYLKIVDYAGNVEFISTDGIILDQALPEIEEKIKPEITLVPETEKVIYNSDVTFAISVIDPKIGDMKAYAGLKEIGYEVQNMGEKTQGGILYKFEYVNENGVNILRITDINAEKLTEERRNYVPKYADLRPEWSNDAAIVVDSGLNNSNDVKVIVYAIDNAGNKNTVEQNIMIDITKPLINVAYNNNDGDVTFAGNTYFKADRLATITVTERNFDPERFTFNLANTDGYIPVLSGWTTVNGTGNGDNTTHTAQLFFNQDGDYTLNTLKCEDMGRNMSEEADPGNSLAPWAFTIDKTAPVVTVAYDNNAALNGNYYKAQRIATITVTEHNFETSRIKISLMATDDGVVSALPAVSDWTSNGNVHTATITYAADSLYTFDFDYIDKAGNATADIAEQTFYVDKTLPVVTIEKIVDESANNTKENIGFVMTATDTNFDVFTPVLTAVVKNGNVFETKKLEIGEITEIKNGKVFTVTNIDTDGIYRITCTVIDKAGNEFAEVNLEKADGSKYVEKRTAKDDLVTFSINRDGSTFEVDQYTADVVKKYYVQNVTDDIVLVEINADPLSEYNVTLNDKKLAKDTDYTVTEEGGNGSWMKYTYRINKSNFADEGEYKLVVSSKDKAGNDAFSDIKDASIAFVVDRTAPVVTVSGLATGGRYQTERQTVTVIPTDDGGSLKSLIINMVDEDGKFLEELLNLNGEALVAELEAKGGQLTFEVGEGLYQNVQIICTDYATGETEDTNTYDSTIKNVSVSTSSFMIFWANKSLRWGTIGGVSAVAIALVAFIILKKKRKEA